MPVFQPIGRPFRQLGVAAHSIVSNPPLRARVLDAYPDAKLWHGPRIHDEDTLIRALQGCDAAIIAMEPVTDKVLSALPDLKIIGKMAAGCEHIDFEAMQRHGVRFGYTFGVNRLSVAELTLSLMIAGLRMLPEQNLAMRAGERPAFKVGRLLSGRTVGIHGCGNIGKEVVRLLAPFRCEILACDIKDYHDFYRDHGMTPVSMDTMLERCEVVSLHLPRTKTTRGLYTADVLARLQPGAVLINTCRGGIVDEQALLAQLEAGRFRAACFDVFDIEPATCDALLRHPRMFATPHLGAAADEIRMQMVDAALRGLTHNELVEPAKYYDN